jgi:hypothetical protein
LTGISGTRSDHEAKVVLGFDHNREWRRGGVEMKNDDKRIILKSTGWMRQDRACGSTSVELWVRPGLNKYGYSHLGVSLVSAWKRHGVVGVK